MCDKVTSPQDKASYAAQQEVTAMKQRIQGAGSLIGSLGYGAAVPLLDQELNQLAYLQDKLFKQQQLVDLLKKHPEFEEYDKISKLLMHR